MRRQTHRKQFFMAFSESFLGRKLREREKNHYNILTQFTGKMLQDTYNLQSTISLDGRLFQTIYLCLQEQGGESKR